MNENIVKIAKETLYNSIKETGEVNKNIDTDTDGNKFIILDGNGFAFDVYIEIDESPYVKNYRPAVLWPADAASPEESEIGGKFSFHVYKIHCWPDDEEDFDLTEYMSPEEIKMVEDMLVFDEDAFIENNDLYESRKIRITEHDIAFMVKRAINEIKAKRASKKREKKQKRKINT